VGHYGVKTLLYGTMLPGPDIGRRAGDVMRATRDAGFGGRASIRGITSAGRTASPPRTPHGRAPRCRRSCDRYTDIFGTAPLTRRAGWQMNVHALRLTQRLGFEYCPTAAGAHPHLPVWNGELIRWPAVADGTLRRWTSLIGRDGINEGNVAAHLLERTKDATTGHVYTLHAELEGMRLARRSSSSSTGLESARLAPRFDAHPARHVAATCAATLRSRPGVRPGSLRHVAPAA